MTEFTFSAAFVLFRVFILVRFDVFLQVIAPDEPLFARRAGEAFLAGVGAEVPLEFVRTKEPFSAEQPVAHKRTFTRVPSEMGFQM